jgi:hypothetical protein
MYYVHSIFFQNLLNYIYVALKTDQCINNDLIKLQTKEHIRKVLVLYYLN